MFQWKSLWIFRGLCLGTAYSWLVDVRRWVLRSVYLTSFPLPACVRSLLGVEGFWRRGRGGGGTSELDSFTFSTPLSSVSYRLQFEVFVSADCYKWALKWWINIPLLKKAFPWYWVHIVHITTAEWYTVPCISISISIHPLPFELFHVLWRYNPELVVRWACRRIHAQYLRFKENDPLLMLQKRKNMVRNVARTISRVCSRSVERSETQKAWQKRVMQLAENPEVHQDEFPSSTVTLCVFICMLAYLHLIFLMHKCLHIDKYPVGVLETVTMVTTVLTLNGSHLG